MSESDAQPTVTSPPNHPLSPREIRGWARDLAVALVLAMVIIVFLYQPVKVEGTSMAPLLSDQERIFINKIVYRFEPIGRGDVIVFWYPLDRTKSFIKRVVGLPGESVEIRRGHLFVDAKEIDEPYVPPNFFDGSSYGPIHLGTQEFFVMGDHRDSSNESRGSGRFREPQFTAKRCSPIGRWRSWEPIPAPPNDVNEDYGRNH